MKLMMSLLLLVVAGPSMFAQVPVAMDVDPKVAEAVLNATYKLENIPYKLKDGKWHKANNTVEISRGTIGKNTIAVILVENGGGSAAFVHLVLLDRNYRQQAYKYLGDRVKVTKIDVLDHGTAMVTALFHGTNDGLCCPTQQRTVSLPLPGGKRPVRVISPK